MLHGICCPTFMLARREGKTNRSTDSKATAHTACKPKALLACTCSHALLRATKKRTQYLIQPRISHCQKYACSVFVTACECLSTFACAKLQVALFCIGLERQNVHVSQCYCTCVMRASAWGMLGSSKPCCTEMRIGLPTVMLISDDGGDAAWNAITPASA